MSEAHRHHLPAQGRTSDIILNLGTCLLALALLFVVRSQLSPSVQNLVVSVPGKDPVPVTFPLSQPSGPEHLTLTFSLVIPAVHPASYAFKVDDCIEAMTINGISILSERFPLCTPHGYASLPIGAALRTGGNAVVMNVRDNGGDLAFNLRSALSDPLSLFVLGATLALLLWGVRSGIHLLPLRYRTRHVFLLILFGFVLRALYAFATPYDVRDFDTGGHLEYIRHVLALWTIPHAADGWELHQAPLYYFLAAAWAKVLALIDLPFDRVIESLQAWSLVFSCASFLAIVASALLFLQRGAARTLAIALAAALPTLVFFSSRISNEVLSAPLGFLSIAALLAWWKNGGKSLLWAACVLAVLGFLTKVSVGLLFPVIVLCILLRRGLSHKQKIRTAAAVCLFILLAAGWLPILRLSEPNPTKTLTFGNTDMNSGMAVGGGTARFFIFNPIEVVRLPFNDTWSDRWRRGAVPEFFLKSAVFSEFNFTPIQPFGSILIAVMLPLLLPMLWGLMRTVRHFGWLPVHLTAGFVLAGAIFYAARFPFAPNADFRQSILLALPLTLYVGEGLRLLPSILRRVFLVFGWAGTVGCSAMLLWLVSGGAVFH